MDELDILLDSLDSSEPVQVASVEESVSPELELALEEFTGASSPRDRLEALKLLIHLIK